MPGDIHSDALAWAQANPQDPRAQDVMAKAWAASNPTDPRSAQIMAKFSGNTPDNRSVGDKLKNILSQSWGKPKPGSVAPVAGTPPLALPGAGVPKALMGAADALAGHWIDRTAANSAVAGAQGAARTPQEGESRLGNAVNAASTGALTSVGLEGLGAAAGLVGKAGRVAGKALTRATSDQANQYADNPSLAEKLYQMQKDNPDGFAQMALGHIKQATQALKENVTDPAIEKLNALMAGKSFRVKPSQYAGTAVEPEIQQAFAKQGPRPQSIPVQVEAAPADPGSLEDFLGKTDQALAKRGYPSQASQQSRRASVESGLTSRTPAPAPDAVPDFFEKTDELSQGPKPLLPKESADFGRGKLAPRSGPSQQTVEIPAQMPDSVEMTGPQVLRAKRAAAKAMDANRAKNPLGYSAANDQEAVASGNLRQAMRDMDERAQAARQQMAEKNGLSQSVVDSAPKLTDLNDQIEKNIRLSDAVRTMPNPANIYSTGEANGSIPMRQIQQHFDDQLGTNFTELSKALDAGRAVNHPGSGVIDDLAFKPAGRMLLRTSGKLTGLKPNGLLTQTLADALRGGSKE